MAGETKSVSYRVKPRNQLALKRLQLNLRLKNMDNVFEYLLERNRALNRIEAEQRKQEKAS